jgi:hypothetical protein
MRGNFKRIYGREIVLFIISGTSASYMTWKSHSKIRQKDVKEAIGWRNKPFGKSIQSQIIPGITLARFAELGRNSQ